MSKIKDHLGARSCRDPGLETVNEDDKETQINGEDLQHASHEKAVEVFKTAQEPIVVEVLRKVSKTDSMKTKMPDMITVSTQTDEYIESAYYSIFDVPTSPSYIPNGSLLQPASRQGVAFAASDDLGLTDLEMANGMEYDEQYDDVDRAFDLEYEEVTLHRDSCDEKVGLTLCYGSAAESQITDVYVGEIEPGSVAALDGTVREGDQILQINGYDVQSREEAIKLFSEITTQVQLLLARPHVEQLDDGFIEARPGLDDLDMMDGESCDMDLTDPYHHQGVDEEEAATTDTATTENSSHRLEKDSGVGRTDESTKNDESSEQELDDYPSPTCRVKFADGLKLSDVSEGQESFVSSGGHEQETPTNERPEAKASHNGVNGYPDPKSSPLKLAPRKGSQNTFETEIALLNREMEQIKMECQEIIACHQRTQQKLQSQNEAVRIETMRSPRMVPKMGTRLDYMRQLQSMQDTVPSPHWFRQEQLGNVQDIRSDGKDKTPSTSSAYPLPESAGATPVTLELLTGDDVKQRKNTMLSLSKPPSGKRELDAELASRIEPPQISAKELRRCENDPSGMAGLMKSGSSNSVSKLSQTDEEHTQSLQDLYVQYADVMYTNTANLQHTIMVQQRLFQQQLRQRARSRRSGSLTDSPKKSSDISPPPSQSELPPDLGSDRLPVPTTPSSSCGVPMEWVVKRRADGSRYITRRPVRNKLLKERAKKIAEERTGMTTDDDVVSELKFGRYWPKEERKRHMEKARDHRKRKEVMLKNKMDTLKEQEECKKEPNILELSHKKMMKHKGKKVLDDFTTLQEVLVHGTREPENKPYNPLLSVTTV